MGDTDLIVEVLGSATFFVVVVVDCLVLLRVSFFFFFYCLVLNGCVCYGCVIFLTV